MPPEIHTILGASTAGMAVLEVLVLDSAPPGIFSVTLLDRMLMPIVLPSGGSTTMVGCGTLAEIRFPVMVSRLGIFVTVSECNPNTPGVPGTTTTYGPYLDAANAGLGAREMCALSTTGSGNFESPDPSPACVMAQTAAQSARRVLTSDCDALRAAIERYNALSAQAAAAWVAVTAFAAAGAASVAVWWVALILFIIAAIAAIVAIVLTAMMSDAQSLVGQDRMRTASDRSIYELARDTVRTICCPDHIFAQLDDPSCP